MDLEIKKEITKDGNIQLVHLIRENSVELRDRLFVEKDLKIKKSIQKAINILPPDLVRIGKGINEALYHNVRYNESDSDSSSVLSYICLSDIHSDEETLAIDSSLVPQKSLTSLSSPENHLNTNFGKSVDLERYGSNREFPRSNYGSLLSEILRKGLSPTIIVPSASSSTAKINTRNSIPFLRDGKLVLDKSKNNYNITSSKMSFTRKINAYNINFRVVDSVLDFHKNDWTSVVCILLDGKRWQLKNFPFRTESDLFRSILGVSIRLTNDVPDPKTVGGAWKILSLILDKEMDNPIKHAQERFWKDLENFINKPASRKFHNTDRL